MSSVDCGGHIFPAKSSRQPTCCGDHANAILLQRIPRLKLVTTVELQSFQVLSVSVNAETRIFRGKSKVAEFTAAVWVFTVDLLASLVLGPDPF